MFAARRPRHERISASLAALNDDDLAALLQAAPANAVGVGGGSSVLDVDGVPVFAKQVPVTHRELAHPHSTANLFDLPTYCQYGMYRLAGPGFGAWRELAANLILTEGVLAGEAESFPLLYHWRVLPGRPPVASEHHDIDAVVAQFGGDPGVRIRFEELAGAASSLVLFFEYIPGSLPDWLDDPVGRAETFERQLFEVVAFLHSRELLHMDGHFANMRADGDRMYLVDFGLATSPRFDLSERRARLCRPPRRPRWRLRSDAVGELAGRQGVRGAGAAQRWPCGSQQVRAPVRERRHSPGPAGSRSGNPGPARPRRSADERLLLAAVRRRNPREIPRPATSLTAEP